MSMSVTAAFGAFDERLQLPREVHRRAKWVREQVDAALVEAGLIRESLLQGSYGRKTMLPPLKDVDICVIFAAAWEHLRQAPGGSARAMRLMREAIVASGRLPEVRFDADAAPAHALQLTIPAVGFTVDLVPAFPTEDPAWLVIADREKDRWDERSDVRRLRDRVAKRNADTGGKLIHQVRMGKSAVRHAALKELVCGLLIESLAYDAITGPMTAQRALLELFRVGATALTGPYEGLACDDLTKKWTPGERQQVLAFFRTCHHRAVEAVGLEEAGDHQAAIGVWRDLLGDEFPAPAAQPIAAALAGLGERGGSVTSSGRASTTRRGAQQARPHRPWRREQ